MPVRLPRFCALPGVWATVESLERLPMATRFALAQARASMLAQPVLRLGFGKFIEQAERKAAFDLLLARAISLARAGGADTPWAACATGILS